MVILVILGLVAVSVIVFTAAGLKIVKQAVLC